MMRCDSTTSLRLLGYSPHTLGVTVQACLKYDLPSCPGVLVDVKNNEDVANMWEELEEVATGCSSTPHRLHIFLDKLSAKGHSMSGHEPGQHEIEGYVSHTPR